MVQGAGEFEEQLLTAEGVSVSEPLELKIVTGKASFRRKTKSGAETARLGRALSALKNPRKIKNARKILPGALSYKKSIPHPSNISARLFISARRYHTK